MSRLQVLSHWFIYLSMPVSHSLDSPNFVVKLWGKGMWALQKLFFLLRSFWPVGPLAFPESLGSANQSPQQGLLWFGWVLGWVAGECGVGSHGGRSSLRQRICFRLDLCSFLWAARSWQCIKSGRYFIVLLNISTFDPIGNGIAFFH